VAGRVDAEHQRVELRPRVAWPRVLPGLVIAVMILGLAGQSMACERIVICSSSLGFILSFGYFVVCMLRAPYRVARLAFSSARCLVVPSLTLSRETGGAGYRDGNLATVSYRGLKGRLIGAGWDGVAREASLGRGRLGVLWVLVDAPGGGRQLVLLPTPEPAEARRLVGEVETFLKKADVHGVAVADEMWGLWTSAYSLRHVEDGAVAPIGATRREAEEYMALSWGPTERAVYSRVSRARKLRVWAGELGDVVIPMLGLGVATVVVPSQVSPLGIPWASSDACSVGCALEMVGVGLLSLVGTTVALTLLLRGAFLRLRHRWLGDSLAHWELLSLRTWEEVEALNERSRASSLSSREGGAVGGAVTDQNSR